jgi:hypothetical protein
MYGKTMEVYWFDGTYQSPAASLGVSHIKGKAE